VNAVTATSVSNIVTAGKTILIVDDSPFQRRRLKEMFSSLGYECIGEVSNGMECLDFLKRQRTAPDIISLDIIMPIMDGIETLTKLREFKCPSTLILVSALGSEEAFSETLLQNLSPDGIFSKRDSRDTFAKGLMQILLQKSTWKSPGVK